MSNYKDGDLIAGKMHRAEDDWHDACSKPSIVAGMVVFLSEKGVTHWGYVRGCSDCDDWIWTRLDGVVVPVRIRETKIEEKDE